MKQLPIPDDKVRYYGLKTGKPCGAQWCMSCAQMLARASHLTLHMAWG